MKKKPGRREFLKKIGAGGAACTLMPTSMLAASGKNTDAANQSGGIQDQQNPNRRAYNSKYQGDFLNRLAFPLGGLGAGMICFEGAGAISHVSIRNKPEIFNEPGMFAAIFVKGLKNGAKLLEGPVPQWKKFGQRESGNGLGGATTGLPHFRQATFLARFPFASLDIEDADLPIKVGLSAWSPFIPTEENDSGLPVAALEYKFKNAGNSALELVFSFNSKNFLSIEKGKNNIASIKNGFVLSESGSEEKPYRSDFAVFSDDEKTVVDHCWFRGGWWDPLTMAWNSVKNGLVKSVAPVEKDAPGASLYVPFTIRCR